MKNIGRHYVLFEIHAVMNIVEIYIMLYNNMQNINIRVI